MQTFQPEFLYRYFKTNYFETLKYSLELNIYLFFLEKTSFAFRSFAFHVIDRLSLFH